MIFGRPVCNLSYPNVLIPVSGVAAFALQDSGNLDVVFYMMRGTTQDVESALAYFNKEYIEATDEYLKNMKVLRSYGTTHAWKNGEQYIILWQHEPGYDAVEMSLNLAIGNKNGIAFAGTDLNTCK